MAPQLTPQQRRQIVVLRERGHTIKEIERRTGITRTTINFWLKRNEQTGGDLTAHHRQVYQRSTTAEQDAAIVAAHASQPSLNTMVTASQYNVSTQTIRRRLKAVGIRVGNSSNKNVNSAAPNQAKQHKTVKPASGPLWQSGQPEKQPKKNRPKKLTANEKTIALNIYNYIEKTLTDYPYKDIVTKTTAEIMGIAQVTLRKILKEHQQKEQQNTPKVSAAPQLQTPSYYPGLCKQER